MEPFKNQFSADRAVTFIDALRRGHPSIDRERFLQGLEAALEPLELKARMELWADRLERELPDSIPQRFDVLLAALAANESDDRGLQGFLVWPLTEIVARRGLPHFEASMAALHEMTQRFTAEFAIRPFLKAERARTLRQFEHWCGDPNHHVRRLVSEGSRPYLPWGERLPEVARNPELTLPLLDALKADPSDYVRLSVANHLNDFSKDHPDRVVEILRAWQKAHPDARQLERLARHACRTLLKKGHSDALGLFGFGDPDAWVLEACRLSPATVRIGEDLHYSLRIRNRSRTQQKLMFDYGIAYRKANGKLTTKVFKGRVRTVPAGESLCLEGKHAFKPVSTRRLYPGTHHFEPRLNGRSFPPHPFSLSP